MFCCHRPRGSFHQVGGLAIETVAEQERLLGQRMNGQHRLLLRSIGRRERKRRAGASLSRLPMGHWLSLLLLGAEQRREKRKGGARATMPAKPKRVVLGLAWLSVSSVHSLAVSEAQGRVLHEVASFPRIAKTHCKAGASFFFFFVPFRSTH